MSGRTLRSRCSSATICNWRHGHGPARVAAGARQLTVVAFFAIFLVLITRASIRKAGGCDEALAIALAIGSVISFASMLMASQVGETAALRLHATELLMLLGTAIVLLFERPRRSGRSRDAADGSSPSAAPAPASWLTLP